MGEIMVDKMLVRSKIGILAEDTVVIYGGRTKEKDDNPLAP